MTPVVAFLRCQRYLLTGRLHFPRDRVGQVVEAKDSREFVVFRQVVVDPTSLQPEKPGAIFKVRFHFAHLPPRANKIFSLLPIPFIVGLKGFRSKTWLIDSVSGEFQGIYEWDTVEDAEAYPDAFALKLMTRRAVPGSVAYEIIPQ